MRSNVRGVQAFGDIRRSRIAIGVPSQAPTTSGSQNSKDFSLLEQPERRDPNGCAPCSRPPRRAGL